MRYLGIDTSNYTTSVAVFDGETGKNCSRLLDVRPGELGLRQSDALFSHVKRLPELFAHLLEESPGPIGAVAVSTRPRAVEGSYMPCFLAGQSQAEVLSSVLQVPLHYVSHQQGHIAASLWSAGRLDLMQKPHLAWHLSGGTTELLLIEPDGCNVKATCIGGTTDISAGQLIDRTGKLLGLSFPAGKLVDALSGESTSTARFAVKTVDMRFSLSGLENKVKEQFDSGASGADVASYALRSIIGAVKKATAQAQTAYPGLEVVFSGGVASNGLLRQELSNAIFAEPQYSTDNALGVAVLCYLQENTNGTTHF